MLTTSTRPITDLTSTEAVRLEHALAEILAIQEHCAVFDAQVIISLGTAHAAVRAFTKTLQETGALPRRSEADAPSQHAPKKRVSMVPADGVPS